MPSWVKDEDKWAKAKEIAKKQYPDVEEGSDKFYSIVTGIYKQSGGTMAKSLTLFLKSATDTAAVYRIEEPQVAVAIARAELVEATDASNNAILFQQDRTDPHPTLEEKVSGDYQMRKVGWQGLTISIENEAGSTRSGTNRDGEKWSQTMKYAYGFVHQTTGTDGDCVDVFLGPDEDAQFVYIVHARKVNRWDEYDEDKVMLNFPTEEAAAAAFLECYSDPRFLGPITPMPVIEFVQKVQNTNGRPTMIKAMLFLKAHIKGYTRKDGTYVPPHDDNRTAAKPATAPKKTFAEGLASLPNAQHDPALSKRQKRLIERRTGQKMVEVWTVPGKEFRGTKYGNSVPMLVSDALAEHHLKEGNLSKERIEGRHLTTGKKDEAPALELTSPPSHHDEPPAPADPDAEMSPEYKAAYDASNVAIKEFGEVTRKYRAREIGDKEFIAGKAKYNAAMKLYDAAYAKEQERGEQRRAANKQGDDE